MKRRGDVSVVSGIEAEQGSAMFRVNRFALLSLSLFNSNWDTEHFGQQLLLLNETELFL